MHLTSDKTKKIHTLDESFIEKGSSRTQNRERKAQFFTSGQVSTEKFKKFIAKILKKQIEISEAKNLSVENR